MLREPYPVVELLGQISRSNAGSKSLVKSVGQIVSRNHGSNSWIKSMGQIGWSNVGNPWPAAGEPRRTHGRAYGWAENGLGWAGKGQRKGPRGEAWARVQLLRFIRRRNTLERLRGL